MSNMPDEVDAGRSGENQSGESSPSNASGIEQWPARRWTLRKKRPAKEETFVTLSERGEYMQGVKQWNLKVCIPYADLLALRPSKTQARALSALAQENAPLSDKIQGLAELAKILELERSKGHV